MKQLLITILILTIILISSGCVAPAPCPTVNCPQTKAPNEEPEIELESIKIYKLVLGTDVYLIEDDNKMDIVNCGRTAYGPVIVEEIKDRLGNLQLRNLIISDTSKEYIGGCKDIIVAFQDIEMVLVYGEFQDTQESNDFIEWTPASKITKVEGTYELPQGEIIELE